MYGGGFSTVPAYLKDMFGTRYVGAIHGLLLTAWSAAGIFGPVLVNYIREYNVTHGVPKAQAYNTTMYIMAGLLVVGFICNFLVKAVDARFHMKERRSRLARTHRRRSGVKGRIKHDNCKARHHSASAPAGMGLRRHPAHSWRAADTGEFDETFPVASQILENTAAAQKGRRFFLDRAPGLIFMASRPVFAGFGGTFVGIENSLNCSRVRSMTLLRYW